MLEIAVISLKEKKAYTLSSIPFYLGNAVAVIKALSKYFKLIHVVDNDVKEGRIKNFDIYDASTYFTHIEVEVSKREFAEKLQKIQARCVVEKDFDCKELDEELLVADMRTSFYQTSIRDVLVSGEVYKKNKERLNGKRIIGWGIKNKGFYGFIDIEKWAKKDSFLRHLI